MAERQFIDVAKVALKLDISVRQVWRLVEWGHLPRPAKVAGETKFDLEDVEVYMIRAKHGGLPKPPKKEKKAPKKENGSP